MSSAFYPLNMNSFSNRLNQGGYKSWKSNGVYRNPRGFVSSNIRPLTNKDYGNVFQTGFGLPRPIKHYRKGKVTPVVTNNLELDYNLNRNVKSSTNANLVSLLSDFPSSNIIKDNSSIDNNNCKLCLSSGFISDWQPIKNLTYKPQKNTTNYPLCCNEQKKALNRIKPANTIIPKNYFQNKYNYLYNRCQTFTQRQFNFLTDKQFTNNINMNEKPGSPESTNLDIYYVAQCNPNILNNYQIYEIFDIIINELHKDKIITQEDVNKYNNLKNKNIQSFYLYLKDLNLDSETYKNIENYINNSLLNDVIYSGSSTNLNCKRVYYKPNNYQYATQGAVSSSARLLKLNVTTIEKQSYLNNKTANYYSNIANDLYQGSDVYIPFVTKTKVEKCNPSKYISNPFFAEGQKPNKNICDLDIIKKIKINKIK